VPIVFDHRTLGQRVLFGTGFGLDNIDRAMEHLGARRVLLIADGFAREIADRVADRVDVVARIDDVVQHVPLDRADAAVALAADHAVDGVITIGGGSATGLAKVVALQLDLPIIAVPTTFAGSEATDVWGLTERSHKRTGSDPRVLPRIVVYDASLTASLPSRAAVASGLNAVAHAVDGFWAPRADPINTALGTEGLRNLVPGLRALVADGDDLDAREQVLHGAYLAAVAFASAGSGMHHKICHVLGGAYALPHAQMHAVLLPYVMDFNAAAAPGAARQVETALGVDSAAEGLWLLREELGAPASLGAIGLRETDITEAARSALAAVPASNPRPVEFDDLRSLLRAAWAGEPIRGQEITQ
jgi:alcohol dehydrogenase class IV